MSNVNKIPIQIIFLTPWYFIILQQITMYVSTDHRMLDFKLSAVGKSPVLIVFISIYTDYCIRFIIHNRLTVIAVKMI